MAGKKYTGTGQILETDYHEVTWTGKTRGGQSAIITLHNAINLGNIDLAFAEKGDTVASATYTATYDNSDETATSTAEPWELVLNGTPTKASEEILLGAGVFAIDGVDIALTRGGGSFSVAREFRNINADGDRGPVKDRIEMDGSTPTLTLNSLQILTRFADLYAGISETVVE